MSFPEFANKGKCTPVLPLARKSKNSNQQKMDYSQERFHDFGISLAARHKRNSIVMESLLAIAENSPFIWFDDFHAIRMHETQFQRAWKVLTNPNGIFSSHFLFNFFFNFFMVFELNDLFQLKSFIYMLGLDSI